jgi:diguanylate cyclase (GGDEF)-like protein/PAS domain S-box-containing protein
MTMTVPAHTEECLGATPDAVFRAAFAHAPAAMALTGGNGRWLEANAALCELLGRSQDELRALTADELTAPGMTVVRVEELGDTRAETCYVGGDGDPVWVSLRARPVGDGRLVVHVGNLTERRRAERRLRRLADNDALTWLPNRRCFLEGLGRELERMHADGAFGALVLIDLDDFKQVNDTAGHAAGDRVLQTAADVLRRRLRSTDLLGRLGGDEFAALVLDVTPRQARAIAAELDAGLRTSTIVHGGRILAIQASIGIADIDERTGVDADALLAAADEAMYRAKSANRAA